MITIHFLNVGKGSCTLLESHAGRLSMIDIYKSTTQDDALTDPVRYLQANYDSHSLFRFVLTHPDMDHMSGLDGLAENVQILNFWDTKHDKTLTDDDWEGSPYRQEDWVRYLGFRESSENPKYLRLYRGQTSECCWAQDNITILSPSEDLVSLSQNAPETDRHKYHHLSYVLMMEHAGTRVLIGGDASPDAWDDMLADCGAEALKAQIFLAPHHGSKNNVHEEAFEAIAPDYVIVSVAEGIDYDYSYYSKLATSGVLSTKDYGCIQITVKDDGAYKPVRVEKNA